MPYLKPEDKEKFEKALREFPSTHTPGELNYVFTMLSRAYLHVNGESYQRHNDIIGALEGAKLEFYRRATGSYEDLKIKLNGDVYD